METPDKISRALTWDDLANEYDKVHNGRKARTLLMETVANWAESRKDLFFIHPVEDTIHKIIK